MNNYIEGLPHKLKIEVSLYIYEKRYQKIKFFHDRHQASFISWMCPLLKPSYFGFNQFIYYEGDEVKDIQFLIEGKASFVLPSFRNCAYIEIDKGDQFGLVDIIGSTQMIGVEIDEWFSK